MKEVKGSIICSYNKRFVLQQGIRVYTMDQSCTNKIFLFRLRRNGLKGTISKCGKLGARITRGNIRAGEVFENNLYFSDNGICYSYDFGKKQLIARHRHRAGMRSPLKYSVIEGIGGFDNQICYGEYFNNANREAVNIWSKNSNSKDWKISAAFHAGEIRHIHGIFPDKRRGCVYVLTGDTDKESGIWIARDNFKSLTRLIGGSQQARACQMMVKEDGFLYCTDSEYEQNILYRVIVDQQNSYRREAIETFEGSILYGAAGDRDFFFSTTVEPDKGGIKSKEVRVFHLLKGGEISELFHAAKDFLPMKLFQYGYARVIPADDAIAISLCGVKKYDGKTVILDMDEIRQRHRI